MVILQEAGEKLAEQLLHTDLSSEEIITARLSDLLPSTPDRTEGFIPVVSRLCAQIPLCCLKYGLVNNQELSDLIYRELAKEQVEVAVQAHVLSFFRGFCRTFFQANSVQNLNECQPLDDSQSRPLLQDVNQPDAEAV